jgi:hypothetical protein
MSRWESPPQPEPRKPGDPGYHGGGWNGGSGKTTKKSSCPLLAAAVLTVGWLLWRRLR